MTSPRRRGAQYDASTHQAYSAAGVALAETWCEGRTRQSIHRKSAEWRALAVFNADGRLRTMWHAAVNRAVTIEGIDENAARNPKGGK